LLLLNLIVRVKQDASREVLGDNRRQSQQAGLSWGYMSAVDREGRRIWVVAAERNAQRFIVHTDEKLTAVIVLEGAIRLR